MLIEISSDFCKVSYEKCGVRRQKLVSLGDLMDELSAYRATNFGLLPRNIRFMESCGNILLMGLEFPSVRRDVKLSKVGYNTQDQQTVEDVILPAGIFFVKIVRYPGGELVHLDSFIYAIKGKRVSFDTDSLYKYPTPNIYDGGRICWGQVTVGEIRQLSSVEGLTNSFFSNNFNEDLFGGRVSSMCDNNGDVTAYFESLSGKESFDDDWLIHTGDTVGVMPSKLLKK